MIAPPLVSSAIDAVDGRARATTVRTPRGTIATPCFMPVGTRGAVRHLAADDLDDLGVQVVLANTYHLMMRPGAELVAELGGLHQMMAWGGHVLTDSGGFQVFSLEPKVDDDGVAFRSTYDGTQHRFTPASVVATQHLLGADIQMVLDVCPPLPSPPHVVAVAMERTAAWAQLASDAMDELRSGGSTQALFGIVQGGIDVDLRRRSAEHTCAVGFDGYGIGGLSVGEPRHEMLPALAAALDELPGDQPRYLMGVGDPRSVIEAIGLGVDLFDCVLPTRLARHGTILTTAGRLNLRNLVHATSDEPLDPACSCPVCARWSRGYLRHLLLVQEPTVKRLCTIHNVHWLLRLVEQARRAIVSGTFESLRADVAVAWP